MIKRYSLFFLGFIFLLITSLSAQSNGSFEILDRVKEKFAATKDYSVDVLITIDVNFIKAPETEAKIYYKQPDKINFVSDGFAMLPKQGIKFSPNSLLTDDITSIYVREDSINNYQTHIIKVIPNSDTGNIVLSTLWIDKNNFLIHKVESTTKTSGSFLMEFDYENTIELGLPSKVVFSFDVDDFKIPAAISGEFLDGAQKPTDVKEKLKGRVIVKYKNYIVNKGLDDSLFD